MANPFATRYTRLGQSGAPDNPGKITPLDEQGRPFDAVVALAALVEAGGCAAFVGPHGSGKSTRLQACAQVALTRGEHVCQIRLRHGSDAFRAAWALRALPAGALVCIDSFEQVGSLGRALLCRLARSRRLRLLVTCHTPLGLPVLATCSTSLPLLETLVAQLSGGECRLSSADIAEAYEGSRGNLREAFFILYDRVEAAERQQRS